MSSLTFEILLHIIERILFEDDTYSADELIRKLVFHSIVPIRNKIQNFEDCIEIFTSLILKKMSFDENWNKLKISPNLRSKILAMKQNNINESMLFVNDLISDN